MVFFLFQVFHLDKDANQKFDAERMDTIYDGLKKDKICDTTKFTLYFKLLSIYWRFEPETLVDGISHLASAYKNGKLTEGFIDRDIPGTPQADISWVRCCHYFIKLGLLKSIILTVKIRILVDSLS